MRPRALPSSDLNDTAPEYALIQLHCCLHRALLLKLDVRIPARNREQSTGDAAQHQGQQHPLPRGGRNPCLCKHSSHALLLFRKQKLCSYSVTGCTQH